MTDTRMAFLASVVGARSRRSIALSLAAVQFAVSGVLDVHGQDLARVPPDEWVAAFRTHGRNTPYPAWDLFIGGCPADEPWRGDALAALLAADLDPSQSALLARMLVGGMDRCRDAAAIEWTVANMQTLAHSRDVDQLLSSYLLLARDHASIREHPALQEMISDGAVEEIVRSRIAFAIQGAMGEEEREDFLIRAMQRGNVPSGWANGASVVLLRERGSSFVRRLAAELDRDPSRAM